MFGWRRVTHTSPPARAYAFWVFFVAAHVHGAHVQGLQPQTPLLQVQDSGLQLHPFCLSVDFIFHFSFHTCRRGSVENLTVLVSGLSRRPGRALFVATEQLQVLSVTQDRQPARISSRAADRHSPFGTKIHAGNIDQVQSLLWMFFIEALDALLKLREIARFIMLLQLLLALAAGENNLAFP